MELQAQINTYALNFIKEKYAACIDAYGLADKDFELSVVQDPGWQTEMTLEPASTSINIVVKDFKYYSGRGTWETLQFAVWESGLSTDNVFPLHQILKEIFEAK